MDAAENVDGASIVNIITERFIPVETDDALTYGTCYLNSKTMKFLIEPGVEKLTISYDQAMAFLREAIITVGDFELKEKAIVAEDGTIIDGVKVYLKTLQISDDVLENVEMTVVKGQKIPVIIGSTTFEDEFGPYRVDKGEQKLIFERK